MRSHLRRSIYRLIEELIELLKAEARLSSLRWVGPRTRFEKLAQARLVKIAHRRFASGLDPFRMLPSQVVVNLLPKLGHGVDSVADYQCFERSSARGEHTSWTNDLAHLFIRNRGRSKARE